MLKTSRFQKPIIMPAHHRIKARIPIVLRNTYSVDLSLNILKLCNRLYGFIYCFTLYTFVNCQNDNK